MTKNDLVVIIAMLESVAAELEAREMTEAVSIIKNRMKRSKQPCKQEQTKIKWGSDHPPP